MNETFGGFGNQANQAANSNNAKKEGEISIEYIPEEKPQQPNVDKHAKEEYVDFEEIN